MEEYTHDHEITISLVQEPPAEIAAGVDTVIVVQVVCSEGCDLRGNTGSVVTHEHELIKEFYINQFFGVNQTDALLIRAPLDPGEYTWSIVYPEQEKDGIIHSEASVSATFTVMEQHQTSIAVWDVDSPVVSGELMKLKVGVRCSANCQLAGKEVVILDYQGTVVASETLGTDLWPNTTALYWTEVEFQPPAIEGIFTWSASFPEQNLEDSHFGSSTTFGFEIVKKPDCVISLEVTEQETGLPINGADVVLQPYRGRTDNRGNARFEVANGYYQIYVTKVKYDTFSIGVLATESQTVKVALSTTPEQEQD